MKNRAMPTMQVLLVHDHQAARAHHGPGAAQRIVIQRQVQVLAGQAAARRPADLHRLEAVLGDLAAPIGDAAADVEHDLAQRGAERHFDQPGVGHVPGQGEGLGAGRGWRAELAEVLRAFIDDPRPRGRASPRY